MSDLLLLVLLVAVAAGMSATLWIAIDAAMSRDGLLAVVPLGLLAVVVALVILGASAIGLAR